MNTFLNILGDIAVLSAIAVPYFKVLRTHKNVLKVIESVDEILKNVSKGAENS